MKIYSNITDTLRTIKPVDGTVSLLCTAEYAERTRYSEASRNDRKDFELVVESAPHGCNVFVRPWSESGMITGGGRPLVDWVVIIMMALALGMLAGLYYV